MRTFIVTVEGDDEGDVIDVWAVRSGIEDEAGVRQVEVSVMEVDLEESTPRAKRVLKAGKTSGVFVEDVA